MEVKILNETTECISNWGIPYAEHEIRKGSEKLNLPNLYLKITVISSTFILFRKCYEDIGFRHRREKDRRSD